MEKSGTIPSALLSELELETLTKSAKHQFLNAKVSIIEKRNINHIK